MNPIERINQIVAGGSAPVSSGFWACEACGKSGDGSLIVCPECSGRAWPGSSMEQAKDRANRAVSAKAPLVTKAPTAVPEDARKAAQKELIEKMKLNALTWTPVGEGVVQTPGYTVWKDKKPSYRWFEPSIDTPQSFGAELRETRSRIDIALVGHLSPDLLKATAFRGEIAASLNIGDGTTIVKSRQKVQIVAKLSSTGGIIYGVKE